MASAKKIAIIGTILLIIGAIIGVAGFFNTFKDPSKEAKKTLIVGSPDYSNTVYLDAGEYDIWYEETSGFFSWGPGDISITDSNGKIIYSTPSARYTESISVNNKNFKKEGSFSVDSSGTFNVTTENSCTLYFTEPISVATGIGICVSGVILGIIGGIIMLVGIILYFSRKKQVQQPPPPPPPQYTCNSCQKPLTFVYQYQRWYCENCKKYV